MFGIGTGFVVFNIMFVLTSLMSLGVFVFVFVRIFSTWNKNNHSPRLTVPATVVSKRTHTSHRHHHGTHSHHHSHSSTSYYVTFEFSSTDRIELLVPSYEFGLLLEDDQGMLSFQGTRYLGFERNHHSS